MIQTSTSPANDHIMTNIGFRGQGCASLKLGTVIERPTLFALLRLTQLNEHLLVL